MEVINEVLELAEQYDRELPSKPVPVSPPLPSQIASWIDYTLLDPQVTSEQVKQACRDAVEYQFAGVIVNPAYVPLVSGLLLNSQVLVGTVVGFPFGASLPAQKVVETLSNIMSGAAEIDMVLNVGALKSQAYGLVLNDLLAVADICRNQMVTLKVILEAPLLTRLEKIIACLLCKNARVDFVKTATGFFSGGATVEDVDLMYRVVSPSVEVKAAGGIRDYNTAMAMINAGATRVGTRTAVQIANEALTLEAQTR